MFFRFCPTFFKLKIFFKNTAIKPWLFNWHKPHYHVHANVRALDRSYKYQHGYSTKYDMNILSINMFANIFFLYIYNMIFLLNWVTCRIRECSSGMLLDRNVWDGLRLQPIKSIHMQWCWQIRVLGCFSSNPKNQFYHCLLCR